MRVTLQNIADKVSLSRSAISRALRDDPRMSAATRERVRRVARKLGYRPNALMSEIASSRWQNAKAAEASVLAYIDRTQKSGHRGASVEGALREQARLLGYRLEVFCREDFPSSARLEKILCNRGITDLILGPVFEKSLTVDFDWGKFICVQLLCGHFPLPLHNVVRDHFTAVVLAWQKAVDRGYRRIGAVLLDHQPNRLADDVLRLSGVRACQTEYFPSLPALPPLRFQTYDPKNPRELVAWAKAHRPDVIVGFSDVHYFTFRQGFQRDTPYISLHTSTASNLSGLSEDNIDCAREAVNLLHFCRRTYQWGIPKRRIDHVIEPLWLEGISLPRTNDGSTAN